MLLRIQFAGDTFTSILRRGFARQDLCGAAVIDTTPPGLAYIDHLEIGEQPAMPYEAGPQTTTLVSGAQVVHPTLHFVQAVRLSIVTLADLRKAVNGVPQLHPIDMKLVFRLALERRFGVPCLTVTYITLRDPVVEPALQQLATALGKPLDEPALRQMLDAALAEPVSQRLGFLDELAALELPPLVHMGLAASVGFGSVEMRFEMRSGGQAGMNVGAWSAFHQQTGVDDLRAGRAWALLLDRQILVERGQRLFDDGLKEAEKKGRFRRSSAPTSTWRVAPPGLDLACSGKAVDALTCLGQDVDVPVDLKVGCTLSLAQKDIGGHPRTVLRADVAASHEAHPDLLPAICAGVEDAFSLDHVLDFAESIFDGSFIGDAFAWLQGTSPAFPVAVAALFGPIGFAILAVVDFAMFALEGDDSKTLDKSLSGCEIPDPNDPDVQVCYVRIGLESDPASYYALTLDEARGRADGLVLAGNVNVQGAARPQIAVSATPFTWVKPPKRCDGPISWSCRSVISVVQTTGDWPFKLCPVRADTFAFGSLPAGKDFTKYVSASVVADMPRAVDLVVAIPPWAIDPASVCCRLFVVTSAGVRSVWIPFPPALDDETLRDGEFWVQVWRVGYCETLVDDWTRYFQRYNPKWSIDPPFDHRAERRLWVVTGEGFRAGDRVLGFDGERRLVEAVAGHDGRVGFGVFAAGETLGIERVPALPVRSTAGVLYRAELVAERSAASADGAHTANVSRDEHRPRLMIHQTQLLEHAHATVATDALRVDGHEEPGGVRFTVAAATGDEEVAVDRHGVVTRLRGLRRLPTADASPGSAGAAMPVARDPRAAMLGSGAPLIAVHGAATEEFRRIAPGIAELAARYEGRAWFDRSAQAGGWFARLDDARGTLAVFRVGGRTSFPLRETHHHE